MFEEDERPATVESLILQGIISGSASPPEAIVLGLQTNMYARARSMIRYAQKKYVRGLPETSGFSLAVDNADIIEAIERDVGFDVILETMGLGQILEFYIMEKSISESFLDPTYFPWGVDPVDTNWEASSPTTEIPVINPDTGLYYVVPNDPLYSHVNFVYTLSFAYTDNLGNPQTWVSPGTYNLIQYQTGDWVQVRYQPLPTTGETLYWLYLINSGVDPIFEGQIDSTSINWEYLPIAVLMRDKVWWDDEFPEDDDDLEVTTYRLLKRLALDAYEIKEEYLAQQEEDDASGDPARTNAEEWDFFIQFAAPIHSTWRGTREYIWHWLQHIEQSGTWTTFEQYQTFLTSGGTQPSSNLHVIEGGTNSYHAFYRWSYIFTVTHDGRYTPEGALEPLKHKRMHSDLYEFGQAGYSRGLIEVHGADVGIATSEPEGQDHNYMVFTRAFKDLVTEEWTYVQVLMMAPNMMYVINTSDAGASNERYVIVEMFPEDPEQDSEFRFPIRIGSLKDTAVMHREDCLSDSLCATVFLVEEIKVKWYQTGFFKWLIVIIVIIVIYLFYQYQYLSTLSALAGAATGATALGLWALYTIVVFALGFIISFAGNLIGGTAGKLFIIFGMVMMRGQNPFSNLAASWGDIAGGVTWGSATGFIQASYPFMNFAMTVYQDLSTAGLEGDLRDFLKDARERQDELDDAWDALGEPPSWLDPMDLIRAQQQTYIESPDNFFERTLNANPGILGYDLITNFAEIALTLPEDMGEYNIIEGVFEEFAIQRGAV